jgi:hypothetical protein
MKINKYLFASIVFAAFIFGLTLEANAQRRRTTRKRPAATKTTAAATAATNAANVAEVKASARKVSDQLKNVTRFVFLLGGIARNIEDIDRDAKTRKLSTAALNANETNKKAVIQGIANFRAGLAALETEFRSKPALKLYNFQIQGISDLSAQAEDLAVGGQFVESGKVFLSIVEKLSDTLVSLP